MGGGGWKHRDPADPGLHIPLGQMTMTDQTAAASPIDLIGMDGEKCTQLGRNRLRKQIPRTLAQQIRQWIGLKSFCARNATPVSVVMRHIRSLRELRRVSNALISHPILPSPISAIAIRAGRSLQPNRHRPSRPAFQA